jgi:hypothetical protein
MKLAISLSLVATVLAQDKPLPAKGDNGVMGGIFGMGGSMSAPKGGLGSLGAKGSEAPKPGPRNTNGGSGPYKAVYKADPSLPKHTIYAPITPPKDLKLPVIVWGVSSSFNSCELVG